MFRIYPTRHKHFGVMPTQVIEHNPETGAETGNTWLEFQYICARKDVKDSNRSVIIVHRPDENGFPVHVGEIVNTHEIIHLN